MSFAHVCMAVVGHKNKSRPDGLEFCGKWSLPDCDWCADHKKEREVEPPKKKEKK